MAEENSETALSRWSRRKAESTETPPEIDLAAKVELSQEDPLNEGDNEAVVPVLTDADMPAIESLDQDSDFSGFMSSGVSDKLRNLALRKLFSGASFNIRDGLDEYDEDYTYFEPLGDIVTCDMKHQMELEVEKLRQAALQEQEEKESEADELVEDLEDVEDSEDAEAQQQLSAEAMDDDELKGQELEQAEKNNIELGEPGDEK